MPTNNGIRKIMTPRELTDKYFALERWPRKPVKPIVLPALNNLVARAAKIIAIAAYPRDAELAKGGPANKFSDAMLAWMFRGAKALNKIQHLPPWIADIKTQQMKNRFGAGVYRLHYRLTSYLALLDAEMAEIERQHLRDGVIPGFTVRYSEDFSRIGITFQSYTEQILPELWRSARRGGDASRKKDIFPSATPGAISSSLQAAILRHRKAFHATYGDSDVVYRNIYNRHMKPTFPVFHIMEVLHGAMKMSVRPNEERVKDPIQRLLLNPVWADEAPAIIAKRASWAVHRLRMLKIPICDCRLVHFPSGC